MKILAFIPFLGFLFPLIAQSTHAGDTLKHSGIGEWEASLELASEEGSAMSLADLLNELLENPLDLNRATAAELQQIPGLSPLCVSRIVARRIRKPFDSVEELSEIEGMTSEKLGNIDPFVIVRKKPSAAPARSVVVRFRTRIARSDVRGPTTSGGVFPGSPEKFYNKLVADITGIRSPGGSDDLDRGRSDPSLVLGLLTEKDPGEANYIDFVTGHVFATIPVLSTRIVVGDYLVESGQGLVLWRSMGFSKGSEVTANVGRNGVGIRPALSSNETGFLRGVGVDIDTHGFDISVFYSNRPFDAATDTNGIITRFATEGLHRTDAELEKRNRARERLLGARVSIEPAFGLKIGASGFNSRFNSMVNLPGPFGFHGDESTVFGIDVCYTQSNFSLFSEIARAQRTQNAGVLGLLLNLQADANVALLVHSYPRDFRNFHGSGFGGTGAGNENESGVYFGLSFRPSDWLSISFYYDQFASPWRITLTSFPSSGNDALLAAKISPMKSLDLELRYRTKEKVAPSQSIGPDGLLWEGDERRHQRNCRFNLVYRSSGGLVWKSRVEIVNVQYPDRQTRQNGMLVYQEVSSCPLPNLDVRVRTVAYETDSYDSRLYEFEEDVPGMYQDPALFGSGFRWYVIGRYDYGRWLGLSVKYSQTRREGGRTSGAESEGVVGNFDTRISVQIDLKL